MDGVPPPGDGLPPPPPAGGWPAAPPPAGPPLGPPAAPGPVAPPPGPPPVVGWGPAVAHDYAGWWRRVTARLVDALVMLPLCALPVIYLIAGPTETVTCHSDALSDPSLCEVPSDPTIVVSLLLGVVALAGAFAYAVALDGSSRGATLGKRALGIRVADLLTGGPIGPARAAMRVLVQAPMAWFTCGIGGVLDVLWPLWDGQGQTLHDKVVSSTVVRTL